MRRSEAKARIMGYLVDYKRDREDEIKYDVSDLANFLLDAVQRIGMIPPKPETGYAKGHWVEMTLKNEWEKEDDSR